MNRKIVLLLLLLNLSSLAFAAESEGILVSGEVFQGSGGVVAAESEGILVSGKLFPEWDSSSVVLSPASYSLEATVDNGALETYELINFNMVFSETPQISSEKSTPFVGAESEGILVSAEIGSGASASSEGIIIFASISLSPDGIGSIASESEGIIVSGKIVVGGSAGAASEGIIVQATISQNSLGNGSSAAESEGIIVNAGINLSESGTINLGLGALDPKEKYAWDFDGDGVFDYHSDLTGDTTYAFPVAGQYLALARVIASDSTEVFDTVLLNVSASLNPKECSINSGQIFDIGLNENAGPVSVTYSNFSSNPVIESVVCASTPSSASLLAGSSCAAGTCSFSCSPYDVERVEFISALNLNDSGVVIACSDFATVNVSNIASICGDGNPDPGEVCGEPGLPVCAGSQSCVDCVCVPLATVATEFMIDSFVVPKSITVNAVPVPVNIVVDIVIWKGNAANATVEVSVSDLSGSQVVEPLVSVQLINPLPANATAFNFSFNIDSSWPEANYFVKAVVKDDSGAVHDSATVVLGVNSTLPIIVPELDFLLLPLIVFSVLAIAFFTGKEIH